MNTKSESISNFTEKRNLEREETKFGMKCCLPDPVHVFNVHVSKGDQIHFEGMEISWTDLLKNEVLQSQGGKQHCT